MGVTELLQADQAALQQMTPLTGGRNYDAELVVRAGRLVTIRGCRVAIVCLFLSCRFVRIRFNKTERFVQFGKPRIRFIRSGRFRNLITWFRNLMTAVTEQAGLNLMLPLRQARRIFRRFVLPLPVQLILQLSRLHMAPQLLKESHLQLECLCVVRLRGEVVVDHLQCPPGILLCQRPGLLYDGFALLFSWCCEVKSGEGVEQGLTIFSLDRHPQHREEELLSDRCRGPVPGLSVDYKEGVGLLPASSLVNPVDQLCEGIAAQAFTKEEPWRRNGLGVDPQTIV